MWPMIENRFPTPAVDQWAVNHYLYRLFCEISILDNVLHALELSHRVIDVRSPAFELRLVCLLWNTQMFLFASGADVIIDKEKVASS